MPEKTKKSKKERDPSTEVAKGRRLKLAPGKSYDFDMPREMAEEVSSELSVADLADSLAGKAGAEADKIYAEFGQKLMEKVIEVGDGKFLDRTGEMVNIVAEQTGVNFPHRVQRYAELSVLSLRPADTWNVTRATPKEMWFEEYSCSINNALSEKGVNLDGLPCSALCLACFTAAVDKVGDQVTVSHAKKLPDDGMCRFIFEVK